MFGKTHKQTDANDASAKVGCIDKMHFPGAATYQIPFRGNRLAPAVPTATICRYLLETGSGYH